MPASRVPIKPGTERWEAWKTEDAPTNPALPVKTGLLASHTTKRVDTNIRKGGLLTTARLLSNSGVTSFARLALLDPPQRAEALHGMPQKERKEALASMTPDLRAETLKALKAGSKARSVGSTAMTQSVGRSPNPALDYRRGETQRNPGKDDAWRVRTLELEKGHSKSDNTVRSTDNRALPSASWSFILGSSAGNSADTACISSR